MKQIKNFVSMTIILITAISICKIYSQDWVVCTKVFDGDTIQISTGKKIRLIGVDTPEFRHPIKGIEYYTKEATLFTKKLVEGKRISLGYKKQKKDKYNRSLAYVYLEDGTFVNAEIIKKGYGFVYDRFPFKYLDEFKEYEKTAREKELGLWKGKGEFELKWVMKQGRKPIEIYNMANDFWGIKYGRFMKPRITSEKLVTELENLRRWVNEYSKKDLAMKLYKNGWLKGK